MDNSDYLKHLKRSESQRRRSGRGGQNRSSIDSSFQDVNSSENRKSPNLNAEFKKLS